MNETKYFTSPSTIPIRLDGRVACQMQPAVYRLEYRSIDASMAVLHACFLTCRHEGCHNGFDSPISASVKGHGTHRPCENMLERMLAGSFSVYVVRCLSESNPVCSVADPDPGS